MSWSRIVLFIVVGVVLMGFIAGCSTWAQQKRHVTTGLANLHEGEWDMMYSVVIHWEDRPEEGAVMRALDVLKAPFDAIQGVAFAITAPTRAISDVAGGDRREVSIVLAIRDLDKADMTVSDVVSAMNDALEKAHVDARVSLSDLGGDDEDELEAPDVP